MSDYLQEIESEYCRIRGRRGLLKPLDWGLAASWESAGLPLAVVLRTMAEVGARFYREAKDGDHINSLHYFDAAVRRAGGQYFANQVGKPAASAPGETLAEHVATDVLRHLENLAVRVQDLAGRLPAMSQQLGTIAAEIRTLATLKTGSDPLLESRLQQLEQALIVMLRSHSTKEENDAFEAAGTSSDAYLRSAQIAAAVRHFWGAPELSLFLDY